MNSQHKQRLQVKANTLRESKLRGTEGMSLLQTHYTKERLYFIAFYHIVRNLLLILDSVLSGVGYHHAGLDVHDRKTMEELFLKGDLPVLSKY